MNRLSNIRRIVQSVADAHRNMLILRTLQEMNGYVSNDHVLSTTTADNLNHVYRDALGRTADSSGLQAYEDHIAIDQSLQDARLAIATSPEAYTVLGNVINAVQNRSSGSSDDAWIRGQQSSIANGSNVAAVRDALIDAPTENGVIDLIYPALHSRAAGQADYDYARKQMHNGLSIKDYVTNEAHTQDAANVLSQSILDIQGRAATTGDAAWIHSQQDSLGQQTKTQRSVRGAVA